MRFYLQPVEYAEACAFVRAFHRHHDPPQGHKFSIGLSDGERVRAVIMVGRPIARHFDDGLTLEVTRMCSDGARNACSMLYRAAWRASVNLGYRRLITYTLPSEGGASLRGAGFRLVGQAGGKDWNHAKRPRRPVQVSGIKTLWEMVDANGQQSRVRVDSDAEDPQPFLLIPD